MASLHYASSHDQPIPLTKELLLTITALEAGKCKAMCIDVPTAVCGTTSAAFVAVGVIRD